MKINNEINIAYKELFTSEARYYILMGGRGGGRSTVASQYATIKLMAKQYFRCAIMRLVFGDIRNSIFTDISDRIEENHLEDTVNIKNHSMVIEHQKNSINAIGFRKTSGQQKSKLKSLANYTDVIIEEADET